MAGRTLGSQELVYKPKLWEMYSNDKLTDEKKYYWPCKPLMTCPVYASERTNKQPMNSQELDLIHKAKDGDSRAFDALVSLHDQRVLQVIYGIIGRRSDAYDVYQETFIRAWRKIDTFRFESSFATWITRIAVNQSLNHTKLARWKRWVMFDFSENPAQDQDAELPDDLLVQQELSKQIKTSVAMLSDRQRTVFVLKHQQGLKIREIAVMLNIAEGTVKNALFRANKRLQKLLTPAEITSGNKIFHQIKRNQS